MTKETKENIRILSMAKDEIQAIQEHLREACNGTEELVLSLKEANSSNALVPVETGFNVDPTVLTDIQEITGELYQGLQAVKFRSKTDKKIKSVQNYLSKIHSMICRKLNRLTDGNPHGIDESYHQTTNGGK
jgi:prefoldin subunit 5